MRDYKVDVAALQETMWSADAVMKGDRGEEIINFQSLVQGYRGLGFYMTAEWRNRLVATKIIDCNNKKGQEVWVGAFTNPV